MAMRYDHAMRLQSRIMVISLLSMRRVYKKAINWHYGKHGNINGKIVISNGDNLGLWGYNQIIWSQYAYDYVSSK